MYDHDLRGEGLKVIHWDIYFRKRDLETAFLHGVSAITDDDYTDMADFKCDIKEEFLSNVEKHRIDRPTKWKEENYPDEGECMRGERLICIPEADHKYVKVNAYVVCREERENPEYEKKQARALETLSTSVSQGVLRVQHIAGDYSPPDVTGERQRDRQPGADTTDD